MDAKHLGKNHKAAWVAMFVTTGLATKAIDERLRAAGMVSMDVYDVLLVLEDAPGHKMRLSDLAERALLTRSGMTRMTDRLEKQGLLERQSCTVDRRVQYAVLTEKGLHERIRAWDVYRDGIAELFAAHLSEQAAVQIAIALEPLATRLHERPPTSARE